VLDNLSTGVKAQVGRGAAFILGDVADTVLVQKTIADHGVKSVIHFAGFDRGAGLDGRSAGLLRQTMSSSRAA